jgi:hypothetical protein
MAALTRRDPRRRITGVAALVGLAGALALALGLTLDPERTLHAYLTAYAYAVSLAVGALILLQIGYLVGSGWMAVLRRIHELAAGALLPLALLFVPIALGAAYIYVWVDPPESAPAHFHHVLEEKRAYLNLPFFCVRAAIYFAIWLLTFGLLRHFSRARDPELPDDEEGLDGGTPVDAPRPAPPPPPPPVGDPIAALRRERIVSAVMLPAVGLAITFAAFDWLMSLQPVWYSTMFGVYYFAGGFVGAIALTVVLTALARRRSLAVLGVVTRHHFHALGRMMLAFTVFWAYVAFFQAFLIQIADRPEEVTFYLDRIHASWEDVAYVLILGHFAVPFLLLLPQRLKFRPRYLAVLAAWILVIHYVDVYWLILPVLDRAGFSPHWVDLAAPAAVLGLTIAWVAWRQRGVPLVAHGDPLLHDGLHYASTTSPEPRTA